MHDLQGRLDQQRGRSYPQSPLVVGVCEVSIHKLHEDEASTHVYKTQMRTQISGLSTLCKLIAEIRRKCDVETFLSIGHLYGGCVSRERQSDTHIDLPRRAEFRNGLRMLRGKSAKEVHTVPPF